MATPSRDEFEELKRQVEQITDLMRAQAICQQQLAAFVAPAPQIEAGKRYTRQEACDYLCVGRTKFDDTRKLLRINPAEKVGRRPLFSQQQVERMKQHLTMEE
ncbi:MAG: hypothetical protein AAGJ46_19990 [Planctomycetota bacterium]